MTNTQSAAMLATTLDSDIFRGVDKEDVKRILTHEEVKRVAVAQGKYIYHHGDKAECFWIIISGELVAQVQSLRNPFHPVRHRPGDITGLKGLIDQGQPRPISMVADSDVELIEIPGHVVMSMKPAIWGQIMINISRILLGRLLACHSREDH